MAIKRLILCHYSDNGQTVLTVQWADGSTTVGSPKNVHMQELWDRAVRENTPFSHVRS